jgi:hypothetical protein
LLDGFEKRGEAEEDDAAHIEVDGEACKDDPPSIIYGTEHKETPNSKLPDITAGGCEFNMQNSYPTGDGIASKKGLGLGRVCRGVSLDKKSLFGLNNHDFLSKQVCALSRVRSALRE